MKYLLTLPFLALIAVATSAFAQSSGQSARVTMGVVEKTESVTLQNTGESGAVGTVAGGAIGYNAGSGKSSPQKRPKRSKSQPPRPGFCVTRTVALNQGSQDTI